LLKTIRALVDGLFALGAWRFTSEQPVARKYVMIVAVERSSHHDFVS
tara:strand:- start:3074 stop:3214 length:141 start_codon:yes stop_codon:yes gene_type:complete